MGDWAPFLGISPHLKKGGADGARRGPAALRVPHFPLPAASGDKPGRLQAGAIASLDPDRAASGTATAPPLEQNPSPSHNTAYCWPLQRRWALQAQESGSCSRDRLVWPPWYSPRPTWLKSARARKPTPGWTATWTHVSRGTRRGRPRQDAGGPAARAAAATAAAGAAQVLSAPRLPAVLSYGLSSEYLKSTKEAEAKSKAPDADRSIYRHASRGARPAAAPGRHVLRGVGARGRAPPDAPALVRRSRLALQPLLCAVAAQHGRAGAAQRVGKGELRRLWSTLCSIS